MPRYEYKVVPAPRKSKKLKGVRGAEARFAATLAELMNELGAEGWEYQRTDTLETEERQGLMGRRTVEQTLLVFRRARPEPAAAGADAEAARPRLKPVSAQDAGAGARTAPPLGTPRLVADRPGADGPAVETAPGTDEVPRG